MSPTPRESSRKAIAAAVLLILGLGCGGLYRLVSGGEQHSYTAGGLPAAGAHITAGQTYLLSVHGGVRTLADRGLDPASIQCEYVSVGSVAQRLAIVAESQDTKAANAFASFTAPFTGPVSVDCLGLGAAFIDDADNAPADLAGWYLVLAVLALTTGVALALSAMRASGLRADFGDGTLSPVCGEDAEIERLVGLVHARSDAGEAAARDGNATGR
jgi:hypothetical protein